MVCQCTKKLEPLFFQKFKTLPVFFSSSACSSKPSFFQPQTCSHTIPVEFTQSYSTGFRACGQALDSIITQTAGWQPTSPSLTWLPPWPLANVINILNQWRKQGGSGRGHERDPLVRFKQLVILCLHLSFTCTSDGVSSARAGKRSVSSKQTVLQNVAILINFSLKTG